MRFPAYVAPSRRPLACVLDAEVVASWVVPQHFTVYTSAVQFRVPSVSVLVPVTWVYELAEVFRGALASGGTTDARIARLLGTLAMLPFFTDDGSEHALTETLRVARAHAIPVWRATYLELAVRTQLPLATESADLSRAATASGVPLFTP